MTDEIILGVISFFTPIVAGIIGLSGGIILIAILFPFLLINGLTHRLLYPTFFMESKI